MDTLGNRIAARGALGIKTRIGNQDTGLISPSIVVATSRTLNVGDNGATLEVTATATLTVPDGLPDNFFCHVAPTTGTTSVARATTATLNGAATTLTRAAATAANTRFTIQKKGSAEAYVVTGV